MEKYTTFMIFLLLLTMSMGVINCEKGQCGVTYVTPTARLGPRQRIVGGTVAQPNSYPWIGSVQNQIQSPKGKKLNHFCGGTLIRVSDLVEASDIVVTAAHCLYGNPTHVLLGAHSISTETKGQQLVQIAKALPHPQYDSQTVANDIAVLKLQTPVTFSQTIQPACLPAPGEKLPDNTPGIVAGWGLLKEDTEQYPDKLQQAVLPVYNLDKCIKHYKEISVAINGTIQFCAGYTQGKIDSCGQDSGGPWILKNSNGRYVLQGVVSFGDGCARPDRPGIYDRVSAYVTWINDKVKELTAVKRQ